MHRILILPDTGTGYPVGPHTGYPAIFLPFTSNWLNKKNCRQCTGKYFSSSSPRLFSSHLLTFSFSPLSLFPSVSFPLFLLLYLQYILSCPLPVISLPRPIYIPLPLCHLVPSFSPPRTFLFPFPFIFFLISDVDPDLYNKSLIRNQIYMERYKSGSGSRTNMQ